VGATKNHSQWVKEQKQSFCSKCQAWKGQLGLEPTPEMYIEHLTDIFNEANRMLKKEGTLWLIIGDTYWSAKGSCYNPGGGKNSIETPRKENDVYPLYRGNKSDVPNLPPKCLAMIPERLAWSLIQNGWILRNKIIWFKPNSMPSSVKDRFSNRWEFIFMFSRNRKYYFDLDAVREPHKYDGRKDTLYKGGPKDMQIGKHERWPNPAGKNPGDVLKAERKWNEVPGQITQSIAQDHGGWYRKDGSPIVDFDKGKNPGDIIHTPTETRTLGAILGVKGAIKVPGGKGWVGHPKGGGAACQKDPRWCPPEEPNPGDFLEINTQPFPEAHFAVFPEKLCERPIKAGCPEQICKRCGKARERIVKLGEIVQTFGSDKGKMAKSNHYGDDTGNRKRIFAKKMITRQHETTGWTSCKCNAGFEGGIVLDPFAGAGTVGVVAKKLGRNFILIDIKKEYCDMAERRIAKVGYQMELRI